jgi:hypothetical protein
MRRERFKTHELARWWLQQNEAVRLHVLRLLLDLPDNTPIFRVEWHDTHPSLDIPGLEVDTLLRVWYADDNGAMVIIEIQLSTDGHKAITWAAYASNVRLRYGVRTILGIMTLFDNVHTRAHRIAPRIASPDVQTRVIGPAILSRRLVPAIDDDNKLQRYVLAWLAGRRIAEYERALIPMLNKALAMDTAPSRWYIFTLYRIAELHAPHVKEQIMNHVKTKAPFQPLFDWEWDAYDRGMENGFKAGIEAGIEKGRADTLMELLAPRIGVRALAELLAGVEESERPRVLQAALERSMAPDA